MYLGRGETLIKDLVSGKELTKRVSIDLTWKEKVDSYTDIDGVKQEDFLGYELTFELVYVLKSTENAQQQLLRELINIRSTELTPRVDRTYKYNITLRLKKDDQKDYYDIITVTAKVEDLVQEIPELLGEIVEPPENPE